MQVAVTALTFVMLATSSQACSARHVWGIEKFLLGGMKTVGALCEVSYRTGLNSEPVRGRAAEDIGDGRIRQIFETGTCEGQAVAILAECDAGLALVNQSYDSRYVLDVSDDQIEYASAVGLMYTRLERGDADLSIDTVSKSAAGYPAISRNEIIAFAEDVRIEGHVIDTACGCREYYPASVGALQ